MNIYRIVIRNINHDQRYVAHTCNVLIPFGHTVADIVTAENEVRLRNTHLTDWRDCLQTSFFLRAVRKSFNLKQIVQYKIRSLSLWIFLWFTEMSIRDRLCRFDKPVVPMAGTD